MDMKTVHASPVHFRMPPRFSGSVESTTSGSASPTFPGYYSPMMNDSALAMSPQLGFSSKRAPLTSSSRNNIIKNYNDEGFADSLKFASLNMNESIDSTVTEMTVLSSNTSRSDPRQSNNRCTLPPWTMDEDRRTVKYSIEQIIEEDLIEVFARDKVGCQHLQERFPKNDFEIRGKLYKAVMSKDSLFLTMARDVFANFFAQLLITESGREEQRWIAAELTNQMHTMCMNRYSCRVVQKALEVLSIDLKCVLLYELRTADCIHLTIDQNANHVVQKIMNMFPVNMWHFIIDSFLVSDEAFFSVVENKYGCRVMQLAIEMLTGEDYRDKHFDRKKEHLDKVLQRVIRNCERLAANEFANYVVQHILCTPSLADYREKIIEECLLRNLLSFSQEKFASHVVEKALANASPDLLKEMMEELFDGYVPDPETKKDCLDILLFHQFGNYVVQRLLTISMTANEHIERGEEIPFREKHKNWARRLESRIFTNASRLKRYSSGKKILDMLTKFHNDRRGMGLRGYSY